jgi:predicted permease
MRSVVHDLRYAFRSLAKSPAFTVAAILMLALGIGANTAVFSLLDDALYQRLPVRDPDALRTVVVMGRSGEEMSNVPAELFDALRESPRAFSDVFAWMRSEMNLDTGGDSERALVQYVSGDYFSSLGVRMAIGRPIGRTDDEHGEAVAVLSHRFWQRRFGGHAHAIGSTLHLNGTPLTIVGVTGPEFFGLDRGTSPDVTIPLPRPSPFTNVWVTVRLAPAATRAAAEGEAQTAMERAIEMIRPRLTRYRSSDRDWYLTLRAGLRPGDKGLGLTMERYVGALWMLLALSAGVLLIACVNTAHLLLARALTRAHEFGVRVALGAGRARLIRQLLVESVVLASLGATAGLLMAPVVHRVLVRLLMQDVTHEVIAFRINTHVVIFCVASAAAAVVLFGLVPAVRATRVDVARVLQRAAPGGRGRRQMLANALIVVQVAVALTLLFGAGLLVRSFRALAELDTGIGVDRMLTMRIAFGPRETGRRHETQIYSDLVERVGAIPGVTTAALGWDSALASGRASKSIWVEGQPVERAQSAGFNVVGPGFFEASGIPLLLGREFTGADAAYAKKVVIVNEAWVRRYAGGQHPIGMRLGDEGAGSIGKYEVVGVVKDSRSMSLRRDPEPMLYQPLLQDEWASSVVLHVRTSDNPWLARDRVRAAIRAVDPRLPVFDETTLEERRSMALAQDRMLAALSSALGLLALVLTAIGVYGVIAFSVGRRTAEVGIRMALGANAGSVRWMVVRETLALVGIGGAIGVPIALAGAMLLRSTLFGVMAWDPLTLTVSVLVLIGIGALAGDLPARRAARLDPAAALRQ